MLRYRVLIASLLALFTIIALAACGGSQPATDAPSEVSGDTSSPPISNSPTKASAPTESAGSTAPASNGLSTEAALAESLTWLVGDIDAMQSVFGEGTESMVGAQITSGATAYLPYWSPARDGRIDFIEISWNPVGLYLQEVAVGGVPAGFTEPLSDTGQIDAPAGACPAGAKPKVAFSTAGGDVITSGLLSSKNLKTINKDYFVRMPGAEPPEVSLVERMRNLVASAGDPLRLATPEGWNEVLWDEMSALQVPAQSLMDYQVWTVSPGVEAEVLAGFRGVLNSMGLPPFVVDAFNASNTSGWMSNSAPDDSDMLAKMDIEAELAGSLEGTVYETREMSVPAPGAKPVFGTQTGYGSVAYNHPTEGKIPFEVEITLDEYDDFGRAVNGTVTGTSQETGYGFGIRFKSDGTKEGDLFQEGKKVGQITMTVDAEKFHNYLNVETNQNEQLAKPAYWNAE